MGRVNLELGGYPNPKQIEAFEANTRYILYGGARAGGKSWTIQRKLSLLCLQYPGIQCLLLRRTFPELEENHIVKLQILLKGVAKYNQNGHVFLFPNGSRIKGGYCKNLTETLQYQGQAYDVIAVDEITQFSEEMFNNLRESNRASGLCRAAFPPRFYMTGNPGGIGHQWVKRLFIDRQYTPKERPSDYTFIKANVYDNKAFMEADPDYVLQLESLPEKRRRMMLLGEWDVVDGAFFEEFRNDPDHYTDRQWTHVIKAFPPKPDWPIYRSFDWGYNKPFSVGWWTVDHDGVVYRILELYGCTGNANEGIRHDPGKVTREISEVEEQHPWLKGKHIIGIADPAIWNKETGKSIAETMESGGVFFQKADNSRINGWMNMHYYMAFSEDGYPMMYAFENCKAFIRTIPLLQYSQTKPEDLDTEMEDHCADECRYFLQSRPIKPRMTAVRDQYYESAVYQALQIEKEDLTPRRVREKTIIVEE